MLGALGVRARLLIAFLGISAFAVLAAAAAIHAFLQVGQVVDRITAERVPAALESLDLSRQVQTIVAAMPALVTVATGPEYEGLSARIQADITRIERLMGSVAIRQADAGALREIEAEAQQVIGNLRRLDDLVGERLAAAGHKELLLQRLTTSFQTSQRQLAPRLRILDSLVARYNAGRNRTGQDAAADQAAIAPLAEEIIALLPVQRAQVEISMLNDRLSQAAETTAPADLPVLTFPVRRSLAMLEDLTRSMELSLAQSLQGRLGEFRALAEGPDSLSAARERELRSILDSQQLLAENTQLSRRLTRAVDRLVTSARRDIDDGSAEIAAVRRHSVAVLAVVVVLSLASATLIVWLYVGRSIIARLTALSESMLAIAAGRLDVALPAEGGDEIGRMAGALKVFRATAIEAEAARLREVSEARHRLTTALESISEGFVLFDAEDRIVQFNSKFRELFGHAVDPEVAAQIASGVRFADLLRAAQHGPMVLPTGEGATAWLDAHLLRQGEPFGTVELSLGERTWLQISERKTQDGGIVAVYTDITEVKRREEELRVAKEQAERALGELKEVQNQLLVQEKMASLGQLVAGVAHEINTPIGTMLTGASFLAKQTMDLRDSFRDGRMRRSDFESYLDTALGVTSLMSANIERVATLVQSFKQVAVDQTSAERRRFDLKAYMAEVRSSLGPRLRATPHTLSIECPPGLIMDSYPGPLAQVLTHLTVNALTHAFSDQDTADRVGRMTITVTPLRNVAVDLRFADDGNGIPAEHLPKIFDPFFTTRRGAGATGLGLHIVFNIVNGTLGGRIRVDSAPGRGTTFILRLPLVAPAD